MIRRAQGAFRKTTIFSGQNLMDTASSATPVWTPGATIIDTAQVQPPTGAVWELQAFSVSGGLSFTQLAARCYGRWGKIIAGIIRPGAPTGVPNDPYVTPMLPLPIDTSMFADLWDPDNDPTPPLSNQGGLTLPVYAALQLPIPMAVTLGDQVAIGVWMLPSLVGDNSGTSTPFQLALWNALYTLTFDDGLPPVAE